MTTSSLIALLPTQGSLTKTSWELPQSMTEGDWKAAGNALSQVDGAMNWWLGDWWRFGENKYGDRKALVDSDEWTGPAFQTCMNAAAICEKFETSRRREVVGFNYHAECVGVPVAEQDQLLDWCELDHAFFNESRISISNNKPHDSKAHAMKVPIEPIMPNAKLNPRDGNAPMKKKPSIGKMNRQTSISAGHNDRANRLSMTILLCE